MLSLASSSVPSVEFVGSLDILESPEISSVVVELHGFGVTSAESLSNKSVMESLSVSKSLVTNSHTEGETHDESRGNSHVVKGSNWRSASNSQLRYAYRDKLSKGDDATGFRVARWLIGKDDEKGFQRMKTKGALAASVFKVKAVASAARMRAARVRAACMRAS